MKKLVLEIPVISDDLKNSLIDDILERISRNGGLLDLTTYRVEDFELEDDFTFDTYAVRISFRNNAGDLMDLESLKQKVLELGDMKISTKIKKVGDKSVTYFRTSNTFESEHVTVSILAAKKNEIHLVDNTADFILEGFTYILEGKIFKSKFDESIKADETANTVIKETFDSLGVAVLRLIDKDITSSILLDNLKADGNGFITWITNRLEFEAYKYKLHLKKIGYDLGKNYYQDLFISHLQSNKFIQYTKFKTIADDKRLIIKRIQELKTIQQINEFLKGLVYTFIREHNFTGNTSTEVIRDILTVLAKERAKNIATTVGVNFLTFYSSTISENLKSIIALDSPLGNARLVTYFEYAKIFNRITDSELESLKYLITRTDNKHIDLFIRKVQVYMNDDRTYNTTSKKYKGFLKDLNMRKKEYAMDLMLETWGIYKTCTPDEVKKLQPFIDLIFKELVIIKEFMEIGTLRKHNDHYGDSASLKADDDLMRTIYISLSNTLKSKSHLTAKAILKSRFKLSGHIDIFEHEMIQEFPDIEIAYVENKL